MNHNMQMQKETGKILHRKFLSENETVSSFV